MDSSTKELLLAISDLEIEKDKDAGSIGRNVQKLESLAKKANAFAEKKKELLKAIESSSSGGYGPAEFENPIALGKFGTGNGEFSNPHGIAISKLGTVWIADMNNSRIQVFQKDEDGFGAARFVKEMKLPEVQFPTALAYDESTDTLWVALRNNQQILHIDPQTPKVKKTVGNIGSFVGVHQILFDHTSGTILVTDGNGVTRLDKDGNTLSNFKLETHQKGGNPFGISVCENGEIVISLNHQGLVQFYDKRGNLIKEIGGPDAYNSPYFNTYGVAADKNGEIIVTNGKNELITTNKDGEVKKKTLLANVAVPKYLHLDHHGDIWTPAEYHTVWFLRRKKI
jgi:streptogramin lyase